SFPPGTTSPTGLDFGPNGELYVLASNGVQRFFLSNCATGSCEVSPHPAAGLNGATLVPPGTAGLSVPTYLKFPHSLSRVAPPPPPTPVMFVGDVDGDKLLRYDATTGTPRPAANLSGADFVAATDRGLYQPRGLVIGPDGNVYVAASLDDHSGYQPGRVLRFNGQTGAPMPAAGQVGAEFVPLGSGGLKSPVGLVFGPDNNLYVSGTESGVLRFDGSTGAPLPASGKSGADFAPSVDSHLKYPRGLAFGPDGNLYVGAWDGTNELLSSSIVRVDGRSGNELDTFVSGLGYAF